MADLIIGDIIVTQISKGLRNIWINVTNQSEGNLELSGDDWDTAYSYISSIKVKTSSTDWDMWLCEDDTYTKTLISTRQIAANRSGDFDITVAREYNPGQDKVYLIYTDNSGTNTADIYIVGESRRH